MFFVNIVDSLCNSVDDLQLGQVNLLCGVICQSCLFIRSQFVANDRPFVRYGKYLPNCLSKLLIFISNSVIFEWTANENSHLNAYDAKTMKCRYIEYETLSHRSNDKNIFMSNEIRQRNVKFESENSYYFASFQYEKIGSKVLTRKSDIVRRSTFFF